MPAAAGPLAILHRAAFPEDPWDRKALEIILRIPGAFGFIGWSEEGPAGFALAQDLGGECEILSLGVLPNRRRRGVGVRLLAAVLNEARRRGHASAVLEVAADNAAAYSLYLRTGFVEVGRRRDYYRRRGGSIDALIMRVQIAPST
ncbi:MAG TPA: GNAT family N-acetyltransferase [Stellaceae bacterium]|nr:GNAT family N-acetyltransferase [Stellaceae bacterium]